MIEMTRQEVLRALADGASAEEFAVLHPSRSPDSFLPLSNSPHLLLNQYTYKLYRKQKTHMVNGFEVEAPMTEEPAYGTAYFVPKASFSAWCSSDTWASVGVDQNLLARRLCFATKEGAIANAKAQLGFDPNEETP